VRSVNINEVNIFENGLLQAFNTVQAGGTSSLIDRIFSSNYAAVSAAGGGSNYVRTNSSTQAFLANNNPGGLANFISTTTSLSGVAGGLLANAGLPLNFVVANPQFLTAVYTGNFGNATYNSAQIELNKRFSRGLSLQGSFVHSRAMGDSEGDSATYRADYRTLRNEHLDKRPLSFDYANVLKINGLYELPFGKGNGSAGTPTASSTISSAAGSLAGLRSSSPASPSPSSLRTPSTTRPSRRRRW